MTQTTSSYPKVILICLSSRLLVFAVQFLANLALPDHSSEDAFVASHVSAFKRSALDIVLQEYVFSGLNHWDGQWFLSIATTGTYQEEEQLVFLPLFPLTVYYVSRIIHWVSLGFANPVTAVMMASFFINTTTFCLAGLALYRLTRLIFKRSDDRFAEETILWFAYNPASIFFTATYSESVFSALTFSGLAALYSGRMLLSSVLFALSALTRSNGLLNAGFILFQILLPQRRGLFSFLLGFILISLCTFISIGPFFWYQQHWIPNKFCPGASFCPSLPTNQTSDAPVSLISTYLPYLSLQSTHWQQGLFNYYQLKQIPNFLLASPVIALTSMIIFGFLRASFISSQKVMADQNSDQLMNLIPFVLHNFSLVLVSVLFLHVQVVTRLVFASSPLIYWYASTLENKSLSHRLTKLFFTSYFFIGTVAFSNRLPWT